MKAVIALLIAVAPAISFAGPGLSEYGFEAIHTATVLMKPEVARCVEKLNQHVNEPSIVSVGSVLTQEVSAFFIEGVDDQNVDWSLDIKEIGGGNYSCTVSIGSDGFNPMGLE